MNFTANIQRGFDGQAPSTKILLDFSPIFLILITMRKIILVVCWLVLLTSGTLSAGEPFSARVEAMGGAGVVIPDDATTIFWNPAGLMYQDHIALDLTLQFDDKDWPGSWGASYLNYNRLQAQGAGLGIYRLKSFPQAGSPGGNVVAALLSTVYRTPIGLPVGLTFKYLNEKWNQEKRRNLFTLDAGFLVPVSSFMVGLSFQSLTSPDSHFLPYRVLAGLGWTYEGKITLVSQAIVNNWSEVQHLNEAADLRFGLELAPIRSLALQGGWAQRPGEKYWTGGVGVSSGDRRSRINLAYHWHPSGNVDDRLYFSLGYYL
jgi:hypothetical protein